MTHLVSEKLSQLLKASLSFFIVCQLLTVSLNAQTTCISYHGGYSTNLEIAPTVGEVPLFGSLQCAVIDTIQLELNTDYSFSSTFGNEYFVVENSAGAQSFHLVNLQSILTQVRTPLYFYQF